MGRLECDYLHALFLLACLREIYCASGPLSVLQSAKALLSYAHANLISVNAAVHTGYLVSIVEFDLSTSYRSPHAWRGKVFPPLLLSVCEAILGETFESENFILGDA